MAEKKNIEWEVLENGCWNITSHYVGKGYPHIRENGKHKGAHVVIYEKHFGKVPRGMVVKHLCNNKKCVNPKHLMCDTYSNNTKDAFKDGIQTSKPANDATKIPVLQTDILTGKVIKEFESAMDAQRETGANNANINKCCNHKYGFKSAGGYGWEYGGNSNGR
jgi:hypothetical protein